MSYDLRKSEIEERVKNASCWCPLLVANDINHYGNFKGKSRVTRFENSKSRITLLCPITPHAANLGPITHHPDNLGSSRVTEIPFATLQNGQAVGAREILIRRHRVQNNSLSRYQDLFNSPKLTSLGDL